MVTATKAGRYEILGELGRGAMGVVYRAKDPSIGRTVAVKTIRLSEEGTGMSHAQLVERFQTEARAAGLLTHPNIVVIYDVGEAEGVYYITMELVNGKSLQSLLDSGEKFMLPRTLRIAEQICSALQFAHSHNVVHRDIKPANIMLDKDDLVKITDFGTAKIMQYGASQQTSAVGTPAYMSPEQIKGKAVDGRTDIFSLGVMLYEMITGQKPFLAQDVATILYRILNEEPVPPHELNPSIPVGVSSTILKALAKSPHLRYENCRELLEDLKNYRPSETGAKANPAPSINRMAARAPIREVKETNFRAEMPRIPGVEARSTPPTPSRATPIPPSDSAASNNFSAETGHQGGGIYAGPTTKLNLAVVTRVATIGVCVVLAAMIGSFALRTIGRIRQSDSDAPPARQDDVAPTQQKSAETGPARKPIYASESNPEVAAVSELARPWSSRSFFFRSLTQSKYVPALIIRLPGPAAKSKSYWAFSLEAPFDQCKLEYTDDVAKIFSDYGFQAEHPMVVNPCSHTVFDPLQLKELPGNILVRGAIVQGYDSRPPYGIEVKVSGNQIQAVAME
ncbi:MAG TPA: serine/threonine-protein kinase [Candidatus Methylomirabilis sp.]|nr:serine/threonine-protein kinase [Candidatus Methylomirabilis sp.]